MKPLPWHTLGHLDARSGALWVAVFCLLQTTAQSAPLALPVLAGAGVLLLMLDALSLRAPTRTDLLLLLWLAVGGLSAVTGLDPARSLLLAVPSLVFVLIYVLLSRAADSDFRVLHAGLLLTALLQMLQLWGGWLMNPAVEPAELVQRIGIAWLAVPNDWVWIACVAPCSLRALRPARWVCIAVLLGVATTAMLLQSRLALCCLLLALLPQLRILATRRGWIIAAVLVAGCVLAAVLWQKGLASMWSRLQLWQAALVIWQDHPWLGIGPHNFVLAYSDAMPAGMVDSRVTPWPHSLPLELLAEWGLSGVLLAAAMAMSAWRMNRRLRESPGFADWAMELALLPAFALEASLLRTWVWVMLAAVLAPAPSCFRPAPVHR